MEQKKSITWDELQASIHSANPRPNEVAWNVYYYLKDHLPEVKKVFGKQRDTSAAAQSDVLSSEEARTLLFIYMRLPIERPSLIHSCILTVAGRMAEAYDDFRFPAFLKLWGFPQALRSEDCQRQTTADGRSFLSLKEKTERRLQTYLLHHPEERDDDVKPNDEASPAADCGIIQMLATKVFEYERNGRKMRAVKLIGADGDELLTDSHLFPCKPWEIEGRLFDVLRRKKKSGGQTNGADSENVIGADDNFTAMEVVVSAKRVAEVFPTVVGYVDSIDEQHGHVHVYDAWSRHFVANKKHTMMVGGGAIRQGAFVVFSPVIPKYDKFKSAVIDSVLDRDNGAKSFGQRKARVTFVDRVKGYCSWQLVEEDGAVRPIVESGTSEPAFTSGFINLSVLTNEQSAALSVGQELPLVVFLKRGKDKQKRPYVPVVV